MNARTILELTPRPLERIRSDIAVAGFFTDERPLRDGVARVDWRLCGGLSKRIERGDLSGEQGDAMLMGCGRALRSPRLLVVGLGDRRNFDPARLTDEMNEAMRRCRGLRCFDIALAPLGVAPDDVPRHAPALVAGLEQAFGDADLPLRIQICVLGSEIPGIQRALVDACQAAGAEQIEVRVPEAAEGVRAPSRAAAPVSMRGGNGPAPLSG